MDPEPFLESLKNLSEHIVACVGVLVFRCRAFGCKLKGRRLEHVVVLSPDSPYAAVHSHTPRPYSKRN